MMDDTEAIEALDEVNAARAKRGLSPFVRDDLLTEGAKRLATFRAQHLLHGHTNNDFAFLPEGAHATSTGCGAMSDDWGWQTCDMYDHYTYAGAAWARGRDSLRYMHLVVR